MYKIRYRHALHATGFYTIVHFRSIEQGVTFYETGNYNHPFYFTDLFCVSGPDICRG